MLNILPMKASQDDSLKTDSAASATGVMAQSKDGVNVKNQCAAVLHRALRLLGQNRIIAKHNF